MIGVTNQPVDNEWSGRSRLRYQVDQKLTEIAVFAIYQTRCGSAQRRSEVLAGISRREAASVTRHSGSSEWKRKALMSNAFEA
jgi:hypothetical protein